VAELRPSALAVERVLFQNNARTAISVGQASGLALVAAARVGIPVAQYSPNEVKLAVAGHGAADKEQVQQMVTRLLRLASVPRPPDAADALALALCHQWAAPLHGRIADAAGAPEPTATSGYERAVAAALARDAT
jgi:crossover junction endodeoxyribonuclease RuvC